MKTRTAIEKCTKTMAYMLSIGYSKEDLPALEKLFWKVRDHRTGEVKKN
jgi:hypothetical protein